MRQSSIIIHRGKKDEKYEIYVEDYVISFLKEKTSEDTGILFYGRKEKNGKRYTIYGAGQDRHLDVFDKYEPLEEIGCRLTQDGPVFLIREKNGTYEVKGYEVFYYDNEEMQDYLIHQDREKDKGSESLTRDTSAAAGQGVFHRTSGYSVGQAVQRSRKSNSHYAVSLQLGFIFVILVAIVINSANSYDKMEQLNQSAEEVFFVMENQEAEEQETEGQETVRNDIVVQREDSRDDILQENVQKENENAESSDQTGSKEQESAEEIAGDEERSEADGQAQSTRAETGAEEKSETTETGDGGKMQAQTAGPEENEEKQSESAAVSSEGTEPPSEEESGSSVEALSRNVARYYEVKRGDTLYMISQKIYGDTSHVNKICELNQITDPDNIHYGQKIILP